MRMIVAAAIAVSFAGAAWAAPVKSVSPTVEKTTITMQADQKEWAQAQCWVCLPWHSDKN